MKLGSAAQAGRPMAFHTPDGAEHDNKKPRRRKPAGRDQAGQQTIAGVRGYAPAKGVAAKLVVPAVVGADRFVVIPAAARRREAGAVRQLHIRRRGQAVAVIAKRVTPAGRKGVDLGRPG
jgi:hypothetical protein